MMTKECARCGARFTARTNRARFCSGACRAAAWRDAPPGAMPPTPPGTGSAAPGPVRVELDRWLVDNDHDRHALADAARAVADRMDAPGWYGLNDTAGSLLSLRVTIESTPSQVGEPAPLRPVE